MAWGFESNRIIKLQKKALRIITSSNYISHTEPLYKQLSLLKVDEILKLQQLKFYYKYLHNDLPRYLQNWRFVFKYEVHGHDTREIKYTLIKLNMNLQRNVSDIICQYY